MIPHSSVMTVAAILKSRLLKMAAERKKYYKKNSQMRTLTKKLLAKYRFLKKLPFSSIIGIFLDQLLLLFKFHGIA